MPAIISLLDELKKRVDRIEENITKLEKIAIESIQTRAQGGGKNNKYSMIYRKISSNLASLRFESKNGKARKII